jgi:GalNAc-alpha-(1->4)-GalNAc-alpha-(1->3)-diNAcBac-PP-undecaprenol alpha-1,4-N-acetyl-D-galactosaminyltransferase
MKVAFAIATLRSGGAERVIVNLANSFAKDGHEIILFYFDDEIPFYPLHENIVLKKIYPFKPTNFFQTGFFLIRILFSLTQQLIKLRPGILISFITFTNIMSLIASWISGVPLILSERVSLVHRESQVVEIARRLFYRFADAIVFQTERIVESYRINKIRLPKDIAVISNPLPPDFIQDTPIAKRKENVILGVGRLEQQKGFDLLIKAFIKSSPADWHLQIVGEGPELDNLLNLAAKSSDSIQFLGRRKDIREIYQRTSIFVLSSRFEGFPNVLCEAMASGCACVSFDCDFGPGEIIRDNVNGILVKEINEFSLAVALDTLINDVNKRKSMEDHAVDIRTSLHPDLIKQQWYDFIDTVVNKRKKKKNRVFLETK